MKNVKVTLLKSEIATLTTAVDNQVASVAMHKRAATGMAQVLRAVTKRYPKASPRKIAGGIYAALGHKPGSKKYNAAKTLVSTVRHEGVVKISTGGKLVKKVASAARKNPAIGEIADAAVAILNKPKYSKKNYLVVYGGNKLSIRTVKTLK